ncbi:MAG: hypothetical protein H7X71_07275 [Chitinophagales bacterium]|nr:hypothetical protein [Chitinophagales bacterium]
MQLKKRVLSMHEHQAKKLSSYSALAATFIAISGSADAQIFYTDVTPDVVLDVNGEFYELDFNGDFVSDVNIRKAFFSFSTVLYTNSGGSAPGIMRMNHAFATGLGSNSLAGTSGVLGVSLGYPYVFAAAEEISAANNWVSYNSQSIVYSLFYKFDTGLSYQVLDDGFWFGGETDKYMGVRFYIGANQHYGWIRMDVSADNKVVTIKDFAFDNIPGDPILAGEPNIVGLDDLLMQSVSVYSFQNTIYVELKDDQFLGSSVQIYTPAGQMIYIDKLTETKKQIVLLEIPAGLFIVKMQNDKASTAKEIFITSSH